MHKIFSTSWNETKTRDNPVTAVVRRKKQQVYLQQNVETPELTCAVSGDGILRVFEGHNQLRMNY